MPKILIKKNIPYTIATLCLVFAAQFSSSQNFEIGVSVGAANYFGDIAPTPVISETKVAAGFFGRLNLSSTWAWNNSFMYAQVSGNDKNFAFNSARNLNFKTNIYEYSSTIEFNYLKYGVGVFGFNPQGYYKGQWYNLRDYQTEGVSYQPYSFAIPFGIGIKWIVSKNINLECQFGFRKTYTDYLDDVSKTYSDNTKRGNVAAMLSDPSILLNNGTTENKQGYKRGNSDISDWYMIAQVSLSYRFYRKVKCSRFY